MIDWDRLDKRLPASIRNRNPGAMYPGKSSRKFGSTGYETLRSKDGVHKIATFDDPIDGAAALFDLMDRAYTGRSIEGAVRRWSGGYYVASYLKVIEGKTHLVRQMQVSKSFMRDGATAIAFAKAMAWHEAGREFPLSDEQWGLAHARAFGKEAIAADFADIPPPVRAPDQETEIAATPPPRPQQRVETAGKQSLTILGALSAAFGATVSYLEEGARLALEAAAKVSEFQAIKGIGASLGANVSSIGFGITIAGIVIVVARRINAALEGKEG